MMSNPNFDPQGQSYGKRAKKACNAIFFRIRQRVKCITYLVCKGAVTEEIHEGPQLAICIGYSGRYGDYLYKTGHTKVERAIPVIYACESKPSRKPIIHSLCVSGRRVERESIRRKKYGAPHTRDICVKQQTTKNWIKK